MISKKLKDEIWDYCRMNDITDVDKFIERMTQQGYNVEKYGNTPVDLTPETIEKIVEVEVEVIKEVEKIVEVEVEKVVEVIKEVPVEVIKEVQVDKEVYITDDTYSKELVKKNSKLVSDLEMEKKHGEVLNRKLLESSKESGERGKKVLTLGEEIKSLKKELEEEKNKPKREKKEIKPPESTTRKSSITWVSQSDKNNDNLYDD